MRVKISTETKILVMILVFIAFLIPPFLLNTTNSYIRALENLDTPEAPEVNGLGDLYKLEEYKSNVIDYVIISVFAGIFRGFTGTTVLETLKSIHLILTLIVLIEVIIIVGAVYYGVRNR